MDLSKKKKMIKNINSKMKQKHQQPNLKKQKQKQKQTNKELEQEHNHRNGGLSARKGRVEMGGEVQGIRSIICRHKIDRGRLRIVWEMEKPKNLHVLPTDMN